MLEVRDLVVTHGTVRAVGGVSLDVGAGEAVALLGPNGAGKTSTLQAISGLVPFRGAVTFDGIDLARTSAEKAATAGLIHVPEGRHVFPSLTVHENLLVGESARGGRTPTYTVDDVYALFPALVALRRRAGWALSGGEQQMVALGRALVGAPRLLLLDEPSLGLAPVVRRAVFDALGEIASSVPMLIVEQNTGAALELCRRAYVLAAGRVVLDGTSDDLSDRRTLIDSYLGQRSATEGG
jgi:branched-chain amino acid transport system ATP-binding protein